MTAMEISSMSLEEKSKKVFEILQNNSEAEKWFAKYSVLISNGGYTTENFYGIFLATWAK